MTTATLFGMMDAIDPQRKLPLRLRKLAAEAYWADVAATREEPEGFTGGLMLKGTPTWGWTNYIAQCEIH